MRGAVNRTLILAALKDRFTNANRLFILGAFLLIGVLPQCFSSSQLPGTTLVVWFAIVLGGGLIGSDVSSRVLHLVVARPVTRAEYVISRWFAVGLSCTVVAWLRLGLVCAIFVARGTPVPSNDVVIHLLDSCALAFGVTSVLAFFSALADGYADLRIYLLGWLLVSVLGFVSSVAGSIWLDVAAQLSCVLLPMLNLKETFGFTVEFLNVVVIYLSTVTGCLALGIVVMNRKELTYAAG
jgi:ABC-type transport system involved in multi-copper enzyme maturation permease subunit